jgi:hypothetical protein
VRNGGSVLDTSFTVFLSIICGREQRHCEIRLLSQNFADCTEGCAHYFSCSARITTARLWALHAARGWFLTAREVLLNNIRQKITIFMRTDHHYQMTLVAHM